MLYSEVVKQFRLREGILERKYTGHAGVNRKDFHGWRASDSVIGTHGYVTASVGGTHTLAHRVIACLKFKRDISFSEKVDHIDNNKLNNHPDNIQITSNRWNSVKDYVYQLPKPTPTGKFAAKISICHTDGRRGTFNVHLGNYSNVSHHRDITTAVRAKYVLPEVNPFRTLYEAGRKDEAKTLVKDYARTLSGCTLR